MNHNDIPYIKHVLDAINDIESSIKNLSKEEFKKSKDAAVRRIEIIGQVIHIDRGICLRLIFSEIFPLEI